MQACASSQHLRTARSSRGARDCGKVQCACAASLGAVAAPPSSSDRPAPLPVCINWLSRGLENATSPRCSRKGAVTRSDRESLLEARSRAPAPRPLFHVAGGNTRSRTRGQRRPQGRGGVRRRAGARRTRRAPAAGFPVCAPCRGPAARRVCGPARELPRVKGRPLRRQRGGRGALAGAPLARCSRADDRVAPHTRGSAPRGRARAARLR